MCGIAGMVYEAAGACTVDWEGLGLALRHLEALAIRADHPEDFATLTQQLEEIVPALRELDAIEQLRASEVRQQLLRDGAAALTDWEHRSTRVVLHPQSNVDTDVLESWNALWVRTRDLAWTLERDVLGALQRTLALIPPGFESTRKARFEAWKLAAILENIGRMEVRGRDSLGISSLIAFSDEAQLTAFRSMAADAGLETELAARCRVHDFTNGAVLIDQSTSPALVFTFKVAQEVGALGDNVARLTQQIQSDMLLWSALAHEHTTSNVFTHTRWASHGHISEPNCHPVTGEMLDSQGAPVASEHHVLAVLNGDVDNYQDLIGTLRRETGLAISSRVTTDTKVIPLLVQHLRGSSESLLQAFCRAVSRFEGSVAIALHSTADPHRTYLALRGSGQSLFVGLMEHGYVFASELYGVVEQTARFIRMDGTNERVPGRPETAGQVFVLDARNPRDLEGIEAWSFDGERLTLEATQIRTAEITTRDINRGEHEHFLLKEIAESPLSVQKTLQGKFHLSASPDGGRAVRMNLGEHVFPARIAERLISGQIRRVLLIGQGTAAIAGAAVASMMERTLAATPLTVRAVKASELSGYSLQARLDDTLVIAISQSGTTTDTNRTVDLARERGAASIAIVNRRGSDLVFKADGVLFTSDGRDIEMSVASTKAFYSQVVAGYLLALHMALLLGAQAQESVHQELEELTRLPDKMRKVLADRTPVRRLAETWATTRRDWAVVGSGSTRAAADEIRIKLSELCYKSIATDFIEDKKHIDLSSEPLTLVCAAGLPLMALRDAVKEVAIFKSHKSIPIVITTEGFDAFEAYAAGVIYVPRASENASVLLNTLIGHLWGYYCARAIDRGAAQLRPARALAVEHLEAAESDSLSAHFFTQIKEVGLVFQADLARGMYNSSLSVETGAQLSNVLYYFTAGRSLKQFKADYQADGSPSSITETLANVLSRAIHELSRPIDAIKHQAKTITVGISRLQETLDGPLFDALRNSQVGLEGLTYRDMALLRALTPATHSVVGMTVYEVTGLGTLGEPLATSRVRTVCKWGSAAGLVSRAENNPTLLGTKEAVVRHRRAFAGLGRKDRRPIVIVPLLPSGQVEGLVLLHLDFTSSLGPEQKAAMLRDIDQRYDDLRSQITEADLEWSDRLLEGVPVADLVTLPIDQVAERILAARSTVGASLGS